MIENHDIWPLDGNDPVARTLRETHHASDSLEIKHRPVDMHKLETEVAELKLRLTHLENEVNILKSVF